MLLEAIKCLCKVFIYLHILKYVYHELWRPLKIFNEFWGVSSAFVMADWKYFQGFIYNLILKEINPDYSLEALMLKLKLQYFGHLMWRADSLEKTLMWRADSLEKTHWERLRAWGEGGDRGWDVWLGSSIQWIWVWANSGRLWRTRKPGVLQSMGSQRVRHDWGTD